MKPVAETEVFNHSRVVGAPSSFWEKSRLCLNCQNFPIIIINDQQQAVIIFTLRLAAEWPSTHSTYKMAQRRMAMLASKCLLVLSFHFFPAVAGQLEGPDEVLGVLNSRGTEDALKEVEKSLKETLGSMKESLGADLQARLNLILAGMAMKGQDFGNEVITRRASSI